MSDLASLHLTPAQRDLQAAVREHSAAQAGDPGTDDGGPHSDRVVEGLVERGWWGLTIDPRYGGSGGGFVDASLFAEEVFRAQLPISGYLPTFIVVAALNAFGTESQREELLGRVARGGVLATSLTEPNVGSDLVSVTTRARRKEGEDGPARVITGHKRWCSLAHVASHILVFCRTSDEADPHHGLSMIFVPRDAEGLTITRIETPVPDLTSELVLDEVRVPADALLGEEGAGWRQAVAGLNFERMILAASSLGLAQRAFDDALAYVQERTQFGRPVGSFQIQQHRFADLATELLKTRLLVRGVAALMDEDPARVLPREASMAKVSATELAKRCALEGMQAMGANGYANEYGMEGYLRTALGSTLFGGTSEIQRNIIAQTLGLGRG